MRGFRPALSLRGAKRRTPGWLLLPLRGNSPSGNPHPKRCDFPSVSVKTTRVKGNGLPRQCAHWLAMTAFFEHLQEICFCLHKPIVIIGILTIGLSKHTDFYDRVPPRTVIARSEATR